VSIVPKSPDEPITRAMSEALRDAWPDGERLAVAFRLASDVDTCSDLLAGVPVSESRLDPGALFEARRRTLVQLSPPIALVDVSEDVL
jgi:hypothetical protein